MKKTFLTPFAVLAAALPSGQASASPSPKPSATDALSPAQPVVGAPRQDGSVSVKSNRDLFNFVLKRNELGQMMAYHESHASHASHASHRSHYSSS
ncbi:MULTISPECIES: His-Xaa-Ser repeat protein HxsA2 [unclassified Thiomonas]|jgi:hypothetical protein|uniref:His-Xaa-Ser repeat protein HxsA2 n=1 Tax=unclassified Thiomonas TaxID=2625466 RepID=UPI0004DBB25E|nr:MULTISPECIES: His-Xaa-Ser repeat protein HxsA2 [unclassified Thiomonas]CDW94494.1 conserved exported hypothetical protein [Thiomonas sp. CB2]VDY04346.1 conserved exported protein of unknown function [Thiomonas sp. Bio17B3]VDY08481.1 conserved exported protein of unknown function [Thiomonas sp. Sup16B3]VDY12591.1 conserved exported protein of unknown function [Thiomonas sp. OC7]VDY18197.1 conserved exported protein of unknown function [Thiomonas sp. CB2]